MGLVVHVNSIFDVFRSLQEVFREWLWIVSDLRIVTILRRVMDTMIVRQGRDNEGFLANGVSAWEGWKAEPRAHDSNKILAVKVIALIARRSFGPPQLGDDSVDLSLASRSKFRVSRNHIIANDS
jgi:hypothetical protein